MHILIDLQGAQTGSRHRGIGRFSDALATAIVRNAGPHRVSVLLNGFFDEMADQVSSRLMDLPTPPEIYRFASLDRIEGLETPKLWRKNAAELVCEWVIGNIAPDVLLLSSLFEGAIDEGVTSIGRIPDGPLTAVVHYDLIPLSDPAKSLTHEGARRWYHSKLGMLRQADLLLPISDAASKEAQALLGPLDDRLATIYSAADGRFRPVADARERLQPLMRRVGLTRPFLMHASAFEARKNFEGLLRAYARLAPHLRARHQLAFVAAIGEEDQIRMRRLADELGLGADELVYVGHVTDQELVWLYNACRLFVFPSLHEGFGLPALEALACGAPVIGSSMSSVPEVIGRADALFDPTSPQDIAERITQALTDPEFYKSLCLHSLPQSQAFSWDRSAKLAIEALERLFQRSARPPAPRDTAYLMDRLAAVREVVHPTRLDVVGLAEVVSENERAFRPAETVDAVATAPAEAHEDRELLRLRSRTWRVDAQLRILMLKLDHIGDFLIALDACRTLSRTWPEAHLTIVCGSWNAGLAHAAGIFDHVAVCDVFPKLGVDYDREELWAKGLHRYRAMGLGFFDMAIDLRYYGDSRPFLMATDAFVRAGYGSPELGLDIALPEVPETELRLHVAGRASALAAAVVETCSPSSAVRELLRPEASDADAGGLVIGLAPGTGNPIKAWGARRFAELAARLAAAYPHARFVLLGSPADRVDCDVIASALPKDRLRNLAGACEMHELPQIVGEFSVFVGNDTSTTHLASLLDVPTLCIFSGQSDVASWRPSGPDAVTLKRRVDCSPCYLTDIAACRFGHRCMDISPAAVAEEVKLLVQLRRETAPPSPGSARWVEETRP